MVTRVKPSSARTAPRRIGDHDGVAGDGPQRVRATQRHVGDVLPRHRQAHGIDVTAHDVGSFVAQGSEFGADGTGHVVHGPARQPPSTKCRNGFRRGLLKCLVGEQPPRRVGELRGRPAPQQRRLDQHGRTIAETRPRRGDVGDTGGIVEPISGGLAQRVAAVVAGQIRDVVERERYDGLTPVSITL